MKVEAILDPQILLLGGSILVGIYLVRYLFLRTLLIDLIPVLFINPRGLISVLLFYSIPEANHINGFGEGALFLIILGSTLMMTVGLVAAIKRT